MDHIKNALDSLTCATPRKPEELMDKDKEKYKTFITLGEDAEAEKKHPVPEVEWVQGYTHGKVHSYPRLFRRPTAAICLWVTARPTTALATLARVRTGLRT